MLGVEGGSTAGFLAGFSLETLLAPFELTEFKRVHWDRSPLALQRGLPGFYDGLTSIAQIDAAISTGAGEAARIDAAEEQAQENDRIWHFDQANPKRSAMDASLARMAEGATLILDHADDAIPGLGRMCRLLMVETGHPWHCSLSATPAGGQGLPVHVSATGVFILQIHGSKDWTFGADQLCRPVAGEHGFSAPKDWETGATTVRLKQGDMLYIPRGVAHCSTVAECSSLHIALTAAEFSWAQLAQTAAPDGVEAVSDTKEDPGRDLLPLGFHRADPDTKACLQTRYPSICEASLQSFYTHQIRQFRPDFAGRFSNALQRKQITIESRFRARKDVLWRMFSGSESCDLLCGPIQLTFPGRVEAFVVQLLNHGGTLGQIEPELTDQERIAAASCLLDRNLIRRL